MMYLKIKRVSIIDQGAFGVFMNHGVPFAVTLERTFDANGKQRVVIPPGVHRCVRTQYYRGDYQTYEILIDGHDRILFHKGNIESDSEGCVLVGEEFGMLEGKPAILQSGKGFNEFMDRAGGEEAFALTVE